MLHLGRRIGDQVLADDVHRTVKVFDIQGIDMNDYRTFIGLLMSSAYCISQD